MYKTMIKRAICLKVLLSLTLITTFTSSAKQQKLLPSDGKTEDYFGYSVAVDGTTALVGAYKADINLHEDAGAAYVYTKVGSGWQQQAKLSVTPAFSNDTLGGKVALKNRIAILGIRNRDDAAEDAGAVVAFEYEESNWSQQQILTATDAKKGDAFGQSIGLTEQFLVIGAPRSDSPLEDTGAVYVYSRSQDSWQFQSKLTADDGMAGDLFGISVAVDGNTILVGADLNDEKAENAGAVYVFSFNGSQWSQQAKLMASDGAKTDIFGVRVALHGDTALISARRDDIEGVGVDAGSAYIFERSNNTWEQTQKLIAPDGNADDRFGRGVALSNDTAIISAMHHDAKDSDAGAAYVFKKQHKRWRLERKILAIDGLSEDRFGWNVSLSNSTAIIAAPHRDDNGETSGAAYVIDLSDKN